MLLDEALESTERIINYLYNQDSKLRRHEHIYERGSAHAAFLNMAEQKMQRCRKTKRPYTLSLSIFNRILTLSLAQGP